MVEDFSKLMSSFREGRAQFLEVYPLGERILSGWTRNDSQLLVDIGGGRGHDLVKIIQQYPETAGHMVLQDQADVVGHAICPEAMEVMAHDI